MQKLVLLIFLIISFSSFTAPEKGRIDQKFFVVQSNYEDIVEFDQLSAELIRLRTNLPNKQYLNDKLDKSDTLSKTRDINLINKSIENVAWLKSSVARTRSEVSFTYRLSLTRLSVAARQLSELYTFTEAETKRIAGIHNDIQAKCELAQGNFVTGYQKVTVLVRTTDRSNNEKKGYQVCWAYSFDDERQRDIKKCFSQNSSPTSDSSLVGGEYVFWAEKLNRNGDGYIIAGPKKVVELNESKKAIDLYIQ